MNILSIETSCDETAVSVVHADGDFPYATYTVLGNALFSQVDIHKDYGGVFPALAKREHAKTLVPMLERALGEAGLDTTAPQKIDDNIRAALAKTFEREPGLADALAAYLDAHGKPDINLIAVTNGPGLEPALWVGINFARALSEYWNIPVVPVNHMEGHVLSSVFTGRIIPDLRFPALALLISGGHTELVLLKTWGEYTLIGQTRDDAVGEAFDKVARMLGLPYPGGPKISALARWARERTLPMYASLPRPMVDSGDHDFSFSGLKTAVRYAIADKTLTDDEKAALARDFEDAVTETLLRKTARAVEEYATETLIIGGGVSANERIRETFHEYFKKEHPTLTVFIPDRALSTDNSVMIAFSGHARMNRALSPADAATMVANGNRHLSDE